MTDEQNDEMVLETNGHQFVARFVEDHWEVSDCLRCGALDPNLPCTAD